MKKLTVVLAISGAALADGPGRIESKYSSTGFDLTADANASHWKAATPVTAGNGRFGEPVPGHRTEIRSRWTDSHIYFLFTCPYEKLYLKPDPSTTAETNKLWEWDVAEVFAGADFQAIHRYREFQVSPQGEWVDLDIDRKNFKPEGGWLWNSGITVKARIDQAKKIWYGEMKIPIASIDSRPAAAGNEMRINFYRIQGPPPDRAHIAWQPVNNQSYHTPEAFGRIVLVK
ncbi:MAG: carbohydrate-binding family 9-like protein [Acidobacteria bacterium]|nr:carbohydrate-binding family 9-like protein [Acidobacteriota bacterium]